MKNYIYGISEEKYALGNASRTSYGIVAYADSEKNGTASIVASVNDITDDKDKLSAFADACNRCGLSLVHLPDAVEDFLAD